MNSVQSKTMEVFNLMDKGLTVEQAHNAVKPAQSLGRSGRHQLEAKYKSWSLTNPKRVNKAVKIVDNILNGKALTKNTEELPTNTQIISVVKDIMDRVEPKVLRSENLNVIATLSPIDLDIYLNRGETES